MEDTKELIQNIVTGDDLAANVTFNAIIQDKVRTVLDIKKVELTSSIYGSSSTVDDES
jgi:hypothetical protein